ncbi:MAG: hypothetical protein QOI64_2025 [Solirubrobacteraceae bacterium]|jgi:hypothetical protein|nr:hypothetical protein [Solirubrobacteraceae bacterium]
MAETETESGGRLPQPTEEIHLPDPSYLPVLLAFGIAIAVTGVVLSWYVVGAGAIITLISLYKWIQLAREEMRELPLEH